jgi:hypothetical protein
MAFSSLARARLFAVALAPALPASAAADEFWVKPSDSIQAAIDRASPGDTIHLLAGTHAEQAIVRTDGLTLAGEPGATLTVPDSIETFTLEGALPTTDTTAFDTAGLVTIVGCHAKVSGLRIEGGRRYADLPALNGVAFVRAGGEVDDCTIEGFDDAGGLIHAGTDADLGGSGVFAINDQDGAIPEVVVRSSTITSWDRFGIAAIGLVPYNTAVRVRLTADGNTITGVGPSDVHEQWGIVAIWGGQGAARGNTVTDVIALPPVLDVGEPSHGIVGEFTSVEDNTLTNVEVGAYIINSSFGGPIWITGNKVIARGPFAFGLGAGGLAATPEILSNTVTLAPFDGPVAGVGTVGISLEGGASGLAADNLVDVEVYGPDNGWPPAAVQVLGAGQTVSGNRLVGPGQQLSVGVLLSFFSPDSIVSQNTFSDFSNGVVILCATGLFAGPPPFRIIDPHETITGNTFVNVGIRRETVNLLLRQ